MPVKEKYAARIGTPEQFHKFLNKPVIYDRWRVHSSRPPFEVLGYVNHPEGATHEDILAVARQQFREPHPVLQDMVKQQADDRETMMGYYKGKPINELGL